jgi:multimeric flavodoxin WrbA
MYGHIATLAKQEAKGIEAAGGKADIYQYISPNPIILVSLSH